MLCFIKMQIIFIFKYEFWKILKWSNNQSSINYLDALWHSWASFIFSFGTIFDSEA